MTPEFFRGNRIFQAGYTGLYCRWQVLWLQNLCANLTGYAPAPPTQPRLFNIAKVGEALKSAIADNRDLLALQQAVRAG